MKETANRWEYKFGINAIIVICESIESRNYTVYLFAEQSSK